MIIESLFNIIYSIFSAIIEPLNLASMPDELLTALDSFIGYMDNGSQLINIFLPINLTPFFIIFAVIFGFDHLYPFIMWVLRKIPFVGIE